MATHYGSLPFREQISYFLGKVNVPTARWADLWKEQHDVGFMVAGAAKADLLADFRTAVEKAIADGTTLAEFRKDFDQIVERHGWRYKGGRAWRTRVIYQTNLRQSYNAGREAQMAVPALRRRRPYGLYRHGGSQEPRPEHLAWDGLVIPLDDPWWNTHTPMNGWGCTCKKFMVSERDLKRMGKSVPDTPPDDGSREWVDPATGEAHQVPNGIDPGFDYAPGTGRVARVREQLDRKAERLGGPVGKRLRESADDLPPAPPRPGQR